MPEVRRDAAYRGAATRAGRPLSRLPRHLARPRRDRRPDPARGHRHAASDPGRRARHAEASSGPPAPDTALAPRPRALPDERPVTPELVREHNLNETEYQAILALLGRAPTLTELGIFSALWSEHCSYKHPRPVLRTFPTDGPQVVQGPGENAGVLRLPDGWAVAFKIESHNHPSAVEPYQGAATGVGGILRDVFTMGARPVALLN